MMRGREGAILLEETAWAKVWRKKSIALGGDECMMVSFIWKSEVGLRSGWARQWSVYGLWWKIWIFSPVITDKSPGDFGGVMEFHTINYAGAHTKIGEVLLGEASGERKTLQRTHSPCSIRGRRDVREIWKAETRLVGTWRTDGSCEVKRGRESR